MSEYERAISPNKVDPYIRGQVFTISGLVNSNHYKRMEDELQLAKSYYEKGMIDEARQAASNCSNEITYLKNRAKLAKDDPMQDRLFASTCTKPEFRFKFRPKEPRKSELLRILKEFDNEIHGYMCIFDGCPNQYHPDCPPPRPPKPDVHRRINREIAPDLKTEYLDKYVKRYLDGEIDKSFENIEKEVKEFLKDQLEQIEKELIENAIKLVVGTLSDPIILTELEDNIYKLKGTYRITESSSYITDASGTSLIIKSTDEENENINITKYSSDGVKIFIIDSEGNINETSYVTQQWIESQGFISAEEATEIIKDYINEVLQETIGEEVESFLTSDQGTEIIINVLNENATVVSGDDLSDLIPDE